MNVSREEAAEALAEIDKAGGKMTRLQSYKSSAVFFIIWGLVWFGANLATHFLPGNTQTNWFVAIALGSLASTIFGMRLTGKRQGDARPGDQAASAWFGKRMGLTSVVVFAFLICLGLVIDPATRAQTNALISMFFAFIYIGVGIWLGWRLFVIGLATAIAILTGYYLFREQYDLWMAFVGGGALIAGGLWLRSA